MFSQFKFWKKSKNEKSKISHWWDNITCCMSWKCDNISESSMEKRPRYFRHLP